MKQALAIVVAVVLTVVVIAELGAESIATRVAIDRAAGRMVFDELRVTSIGRPASPGLVVGRLRDVEVVAHGVVVEGLRVERAEVAVDELPLPWSPIADDAIPATAQLEVVEPDLGAALAARVGGPIDPVVELEDGVVALGVEPLPARVRTEVAVHDGRLRLTPTGRLPAWFTSLGLQLELDVLDLPGGSEVDRIEVEEGRMLVELRLDLMDIGVDPDDVTDDAS